MAARADGEATLIQLSDPHVFVPGALRPSFLLDKRLLGGANALLRRQRIHDYDVTLAALDTITGLRPDHVVVTGDISTLGLEPEFRRFRQSLERLPLSSDQITVIPGNHDAYLASVVRSGSFQRVFEPYLRPDVEFQSQEWPVIRIRGPLALVACTTARPSAPLLAVGTLGARQLARLEASLADPRLACRFRVVALHHPPQPGVGHWHNRLTDAAAVRQVIARQGAGLVLHGHLHRPIAGELEGPESPVPVRGVGSVSSCKMTPLRRGQFRRFRFRADGLVDEELWAYRALQHRFSPVT
ncbi:MAG: metallophosphoesterase [bacterium]